MIGGIEKCVDLGHGHAHFRLPYLPDFVAGADDAFLQDAEVEAGPSTGRQQRRHPRLVHPNADAIAGDTGLSDLEQRATDLVTVADADGIVGQSLDGEVLAKLSVDEIGSVELLLPITIRLDLVDEDGALLAAVAGQVALSISFQIQPPDPAPARQRFLPDPGVHGTTLPLDVAWKTYVHR